MSRWIVFSASLATMASAMTLPTGASAQEYKLQMGHYLSGGEFLKVEQQFADAVEERTGGEVVINIVPSGGLGKGSELLGLVSHGAIDLAAIVPGYYPDELVYAQVFQIPFVYNSSEQAIDVSRNLYADMTEFAEEMASHNVHFLFQQSLGSYYFTGPGENCDTVDGLKDKKIRTYGTWIPKIVTAADAVPLSVSIPELYEALQRGTLDYSFLNMGNIPAYRLYEPGKYTCGPVWSGAGHLIVMGSRTWDKLPEEYQNIITEEAAKAQDNYVEWLKQNDADSIAAIQDGGGIVKEFPAEQLEEWKSKTPDLLQQWADDMAARGKGDGAAAVVTRIKELTAE